MSSSYGYDTIRHRQDPKSRFPDPSTFAEILKFRQENASICSNENVHKKYKKSSHQNNHNQEYNTKRLTDHQISEELEKTLNFDKSLEEEHVKGLYEKKFRDEMREKMDHERLKRKYKAWLEMGQRANMANERKCQMFLDFDDKNHPRYSRQTRASKSRYEDNKLDESMKYSTKSVDFLNPPNPRNLCDPRIIDYTVSERLFPEPVYTNRTDMETLDEHYKTNNKVNGIQQEDPDNKDLSSLSPKKKSQYSSSNNDIKYIRLNFPRHRINHEHCSVVRNAKPQILIRNEADLACSYSLLANSNNNVKNGGAGFKIFKPKHFAPKNRQTIDLKSAFRENAYTKIRKINKEAETAERVYEALNSSDLALKERNFYQRSKDAQEWINRSRLENEQEIQEAKQGYQQFLEEKYQESVDDLANIKSIRSPTKLLSNLAVNKQLEFLNKVSPKKVKKVQEEVKFDDECETEYETVCSSIFLPHEYQ